MTPLFFLFLQSLGTFNCSSSGYVVYCPSMGRFGNQLDHLLGALGFANRQQRTLVLPPFIRYRRTAENSGVEFVAFDEVFDMAVLSNHASVITLRNFTTVMKQCWHHRALYCVSNGAKAPCRISAASPSREFWDSIDVKFNESFMYSAVLGTNTTQWLLDFPVDTHPVLTFDTPPFDYPVGAKDGWWHKFFVWARARRHQFEAYLRRESVTEFGYVAGHLRAEADWIVTCVSMASAGATELMSSPQCGYTFDTSTLIPTSVCLPDMESVAKRLVGEARAAKVQFIFVGTDCEPCWYQLRTFINHIDGDIRLLDNTFGEPLSTDLQLFTRAAKFVGNCLSSFSAAAARARNAEGMPVETTGWWGIQNSATQWNENKSEQAYDNARSKFDAIYGVGAIGMLEEETWEVGPDGKWTQSPHGNQQQLIESNVREVLSKSSCDILMSSELDLRPRSDPSSAIGCGERSGKLNGCLLLVIVAIQGVKQKNCKINYDVEGSLSWYDDWKTESIKFPHLTELKGDLEIKNSGIRLIDFPRLRVIRGNLVIQDLPALSYISFPALVAIDGDLIVQAVGECESLTFRRLNNIGGNFFLADNPMIRMLGLPAIRTISESLHFQGNAILHTIHMQVENIGGFVCLYRNPALLTVTVPKLTTLVGSLYVAHCSRLSLVAGDGFWQHKKSLEIIYRRDLPFPYELDVISSIRLCQSILYRKWLGKKRCL